MYGCVECVYFVLMFVYDNMCIYIYICIYIYMAQRCQSPPQLVMGQTSPPPSVVVVLWLGCGGLGLGFIV